MTHLLVIANETVAGRALTDAVKRRADEADEFQVTVVCPVNAPREGYVVYEDTRRAAARRRLDKTLAQLQEVGISADGFVVETDPVDAVRDALAQLEPPVDEIIVSTHPRERSGWLRRNVVDRIRKVAGRLPVEHVVVDLAEEGGAANVLVVANETVLGEPLLEAIKERAAFSPASFMIICPQSDLQMTGHPEAERRLRRALGALRGAGIDAHGQIAHPDPYTAALHAVQDERVDEIIVSTFPGKMQSSWLRKDVVARLRDATKLPVEHVEVAPEAVAV
jgi:predicted deacetylase